MLSMGLEFKFKIAASNLKIALACWYLVGPYSAEEIKIRVGLWEGD